MGDFKRNQDRHSSGRDVRRFSERGGERRGPVAKFQTVCDKCGQNCEVPFRPTEGKSVFCDSCFQNKRENEGDGERSRERFSRKSFDNRRSSSRDNFQNNSFKGNSDEVKKQLEIMNEKMDRLIKAVESMASAETLTKDKEVIPEVKTKKTTKKTKYVKK